MKKFAGVAQPDRAPDASHPEVASSNLAPRSIRPELQAFAAGLRVIDPPAILLGYGDGARGLFRLSVDDPLGRGDGSIDALDYLRGWLEGRQANRRRG